MKTVESDIVVRRVDFDFDPERVPKRWFRDDLFLSLFDDALSLLFPEGERFFVESVKRYKDLIRDPDLLRRVAAFSAQEAMHGREHRAFNEMLRAQGFESPAHLEAHLSRVLDRVRRLLPKEAQLAVTCALEHFTAILAAQLLSTPEIRDDMHPSVRRLWEWHALEESEHRAVAFDVYRAIGGGYLLRIAIMIATTIVFLAEVTHFHARLLLEERALFDVRGWMRGLFHLWIHPGHFSRLLPGYLAYFRPSFHPHDHDTTALLADWKARFAIIASP